MLAKRLCSGYAETLHDVRARPVSVLLEEGVSDQAERWFSNGHADVFRSEG
jgi:hypothetical protein